MQHVLSNCSRLCTIDGIRYREGRGMEIRNEDFMMFMDRAILPVGLPQALEDWRFLFAGAAPRRPEVNDDWISLVACQIDFSPFEERQLELRRGLADSGEPAASGHRCAVGKADAQ